MPLYILRILDLFLHRVNLLEITMRTHGPAQKHMWQMPAPLKISRTTMQADISPPQTRLLSAHRVTVLLQAVSLTHFRKLQLSR